MYDRYAKRENGQQERALYREATYFFDTAPLLQT